MTVGAQQFPAILMSRFVEVAALLPLLHSPPGDTVVAAVGPVAHLMAQEALRWRNTVSVLCVGPLPTAINDRRVQEMEKLAPASCQVLLLSPDQDPDSWSSALKPGGIIQVMTLDPTKVRALHLRMRSLFGNATPWRDHLPTPIYGVMSSIGGTQSPKRLRKPPPSAQHLSEKFLPCLFTFGKDELPLVFLQPTGRLLPPSSN